MPDLIGTPDHVRAQLVELYASGELFTMTPPRDAGRGRVLVRVELTPTRPRQRPAGYPDRVGTRPRQGWQVPAAVIGGAVVVVGALVALLWWAVLWLADHVAVVLGAGVVVVLGAGLLARVAGVGGRGEHPCNR